MRRRQTMLSQERLPDWLPHYHHAGAGPSCNLRPFTTDLYLVTFVYGPANLLNAHFLSHYINLGVDAANMRVFVEDGPPGAVAELAATRGTLRTLRRAGVPDAGVTVVSHGNSTESAALGLANDFVAELPPSAYVIRPDADEHFTYPCDMVERLREHDLWCADRQDRMAPDGTLRAIRPLPELAVQFPTACYVRQWSRASMPTVKVALMRATSRVTGRRRTFKPSHRLYDQLAKGSAKTGGCRRLGYYAHFSLNEDALNTTLGRRGTAYGSSTWEADEDERVARFMQDHLPSRRTDARQHPYCTPPPNSTATGSFHIHGWLEPPTHEAALAAAQRAASTSAAVATAWLASRVPSSAAAVAAVPVAAVAAAEVPAAAVGSAGAVGSAAMGSGLAGSRLESSLPPSAFDGCQHVFLDLGANMGTNIAKLFEPGEKPPRGSLQRAFARYFGGTARERQRSVCALGIEPNVHHAARLSQIQQAHRAAGWRTTFLARAASTEEDQIINFYFDESRRGKAHGEWGASIYSTKDNRGRGRGGANGTDGRSTPTRTIDIAGLIQRDVLRRRLPPESRGEAHALRRPSVVLKMDIEGSEFALISRLLALGLLCQLDFVGVEFHDEPKFLTLLNAANAPRNFAKVLQFTRANAGPACGVELVNLGLRDNA